MTKDYVRTKTFSTTFFAGHAVPYGIKLVGSSIHQRRGVGQNARFEIVGRRRAQHQSDWRNLYKRSRNRRSAF